LDNPTSIGYFSMPISPLTNMSPTLIQNKKPQKIDFTFVIPSLNIDAILYVFPNLKYIYVSGPIIGSTVTVGFTFSDTTLMDQNGGFVISSTNSSCPAPFTQQDCPVDCQILSDWSEWSACDANGMKTRTKQHISAMNGGTECVVSDILETQHCPIDCKSDNNWSEWSACDANGVKWRVSGKIEAQYGGKECTDNEIKQEAFCDPIDCGYGQWSDWFACDPITGTQSRIRNALSPAEFGGKECSILDEVETVPCTPSCDYTLSSKSDTCKLAKKMIIPVINPSPPQSSTQTSTQSSTQQSSSTTPISPTVLAPLAPLVNGVPIETPDMSRNTFIMNASTASSSYSDLPNTQENACYVSCMNDPSCMTAEWNNKTSLCKLKP
jgi:hypothetical protein